MSERIKIAKLERHLTRHPGQVGLTLVPCDSVAALLRLARAAHEFEHLVGSDEAYLPQTVRDALDAFDFGDEP